MPDREERKQIQIQLGRFMPNMKFLNNIAEFSDFKNSNAYIESEAIP